jgi:hypothetical protein
MRFPVLPSRGGVTIIRPLMTEVGQHLETVDVEKVLPIATTQEKRLRFAWEQLPAKEFLMNWNHAMEPNSLFIEALDDAGITVTVRWALMKKSPEQIRDRLNRWLAKVEGDTYRRSGIAGKHL